MKSLNRAILLLKSFSLENQRLNADDMAKRLEIPKSSVYRILRCLTKAGLVENKTGRYQVGPALYTLGSLYLSTTDIFSACSPVIKTLNDLTGETTLISILDDKGYITVLFREESKYTLKVGVRTGFSSPAHANAAGKALLSELTSKEIDSLYPEEKLKSLTKKTVATKTELKRELVYIRKTGVAFNSEQTSEGIDAVAAVIRDDRGKAVAAVGIVIPTVRMTAVQQQKLSTLIKLGADLINYRLGFRCSDNNPPGIEEIRDWWEQNRI